MSDFLSETFDLSGIVPPEKMLEPGLYINLDEDAYHAAFGLSASGIKHLRCSPLDWWARSCLNPDLADVLDEDGDTEARFLGRAFDRRIVEGKAAFDRCYAQSIDVAEYPGCLRTNDDLKEWLRERDLKIGGNKQELIDRVLEADPAARIWDVIEQGYRAEHDGKQFLSAKMLHKIEIAAKMIEAHPLLSKAFSGGIPQPSIIWDCPKIGVRCKARLDILKPRAIVDLKTWGNPQNKPPEIGIPREIASKKYHVQAAMYDEAASFVSTFIREGRVFGDCEQSLLNALAANYEKQFLLVFQAKGVAPFARGYVLPKDGQAFQIGKVEVENAKQTFRTYLEKYGALPWIDDHGIENLDDAAIPPWAYE